MCAMPSAIRVRERFPGTDIERYAAFIGESLKKTKAREFVPSQEEIAALLVRQEMSTTVYCHGGGSCKISINSHTTAGEVWDEYTILQKKKVATGRGNTRVLMLFVFCVAAAAGCGEVDPRFGHGGQQEPLFSV